MPSQMIVPESLRRCCPAVAVDDLARGNGAQDDKQRTRSAMNEFELQRRFDALPLLRSRTEYGERLRSALADALALVEHGDDKARGMALGLVNAERARLLIAVAHARGAGVRAGDMPVGQMLAGVRAFGHANLLGSDPGENGRLLRELEDDLARQMGEP